MYEKAAEKNQKYVSQITTINSALLVSLYITGTLYSGELIGRCIHIILCDSPHGHKYWCGRPEGGLLLRGRSACIHLPDSHMTSAMLTPSPPQHPPLRHRALGHTLIDIGSSKLSTNS